MTASALYTGHIRHRRFGPQRNDFRYRIYLAYLDLAELDTVFLGRWFWSVRRPALVRFRRADFLGDPSVPLDTAVRDRVAGETGRRPRGPIRLLSHIRQFGYNFNPVSFYYIFDITGKRLETVVAEITNTPWDERHAYVLEVDRAERVGAHVLRWQFDKAFHVSPFLPMDMEYDWRFSEPGDTLFVNMENWRDGKSQFDATLTLRREPITGRSLARVLAAFPLITFKVTFLIYWQALVLLIKRTPLFAHPNS
ncbi:MAG: DUF1365 domain-containing protein [Gammaproteobacteria bacterium]|nr:DUF1365 domain-containing protein [Gammaproteobacteria bacterium]